MKDTIQIAVIGAGANTKLHHIPKLQSQKGVHIIGVCNRTRESSQSVAFQFNIPKIYSHWLEAVEDPEADAVVIGTWPYLHARAAAAALEAGKHVLTEARMASTAGEARMMYEAAQKRPDLTVQIVPAPFSLGFDHTIRRLLSEGYVGELMLVEHAASFPFPERDAPMHWRQDRDLSGFNIAMLGIYYETIMRWIGVASRVSAMTRVFIRRRPDSTGIMRTVEVPDHVDVIAEMACGAQLRMQQSLARVFRNHDDGIWLHGDEGVLRFHDEKLFGARRGYQELQEITVLPQERIGWRVEEEFIGSIRGTENVVYTRFEDGVKYMEFTEAVSRSAAQRRQVVLPLELDA